MATPAVPDTGFEYLNKLSFDQAKVVSREKLNALGSYQLTINYNVINSRIKEDCVEWLNENRTSFEDETISNKLYEGVWKSVTIGYDESKSIIQQVFKVDSSVGDLGDWDGEPPEPLKAVWDAQFGDISRVSDGMLIEKAYYWKITNPEDVNLPSGATDITGQIWTKTANDNGDGTYDVVVSREIEENLEGTNTAENYAFTEVTEVDTNDVAKTVPVANLGDEVSVTNTPQENGLFRTTETTKTGKKQTATNTTVSDGFTEVTNIATNDSAQAAPTAVDGTIKSVTNRPLPNGLYDTTSTTKTFENQTGDSTSLTWGESEDAVDVTDILVSGATNSAANQYYEHTSGVLGATTGTWTGRTDSNWRINGNGTNWDIKLNISPFTEEANHPAANLNSSEWYSGATYREELVVQIGFNPPPFETESEVNTNNSEQSFVSEGGSIADPVQGEEKTITNMPLDNGKFKTTVTTTTANEQRIPALFDASIIASAGNEDQSAVTVGKNTTFATYQLALNNLRANKLTLNNSVSVSINKFGLYDWTIRSLEVIDV